MKEKYCIIGMLFVIISLITFNVLRTDNIDISMYDNNMSNYSYDYTDNHKNIDIEEKDIILLTSCLYLEARGEGQLGMELVASVIYNRSINKNVSLTDTIIKNKQFKHNQNILDTPISGYQDRQEWLVARYIATNMLNGTFVPKGEWDHFYNPTLASPSWGKHLTNIYVYKNHKFGKMKS